MPDTVVVAVLSLLGTLIGSFGGTQLIKYRIAVSYTHLTLPTILRV